MADTKYYDGTKLLSMTDINGKQPTIYMCTTNRTGGKTTYFNRLLVNRVIDKDSKFALFYRFDYDLADVPDKFFKDIKGLFFNGLDMDAKKIAKGKAIELYIGKQGDENHASCGYAFAINTANAIKNYSHMFSDADRILFDEFQSETNTYCPDEITKFFSLYTSIARGHGKQYRYVPVYMIGNPVSIINPYYCRLGISNRLRNNTHFLRGDGWVLEQGFVKSASDAQKESGFFRAFSDEKYAAYSAEGVYLNDNAAFIESPKGKNYYICTLRYMGKDYAIREYLDSGIVYCDTRADVSHPRRVAVTTDDHNINYVMLKHNDFLLAGLRSLFEKGSFRFRDLQCKDAVLAALSYF